MPPYKRGINVSARDGYISIFKRFPSVKGDCIFPCVEDVTGRYGGETFYVSILEEYTLLSKSIDIGSLNPLIPIATQVIGA